MMRQKPECWQWVDLNVPGGSPLKLKKDAPDDVKEKFNEWNQKKLEYESSFHKTKDFE